MDPETKDNAAPAEQGAAQPDATGTPPAKSAAETKLEGQLKEAKAKGEGFKKERDTFKQERDTAIGERDAAKQENEQLKAELADLKNPAAPEASTTAVSEPSEEEHIKDVLRRNGLKVAYMLPSGPCFSEAHAREFAGAEFDSLTVVTAE